VKSEINIGFANMINNDDGISPDGSQIVISNFRAHYITKESDWITFDNIDWRSSDICIASGGIPRPITTKTPSFWNV
jgi:hypothetical protein